MRRRGGLLERRSAPRVAVPDRRGRPLRPADAVTRGPVASGPLPPASAETGRISSTSTAHWSTSPTRPTACASTAMLLQLIEELYPYDGRGGGVDQRPLDRRHRPPVPGHAIARRRAARHRAARCRAGVIARMPFPSQQLDWARRRLARCGRASTPACCSRTRVSRWPCTTGARRSWPATRIALMRSLLPRVGDRVLCPSRQARRGTEACRQGQRGRRARIHAGGALSGRTPVFIGDDVTDEYGFATVNDCGATRSRSARARPSRSSDWRASPKRGPGTERAAGEGA